MKLKLVVLIILIAYNLKSQQTKIIAHRGFSSVAPENTLSAFKKAIEIGADYFELDVHKTKDDSIVVIHDSNTKRTSSDGKNMIIANNTFNKLNECKMGYSDKFKNKFANEKLPTLRQALLLAKGKIKVCIEVKVHGAEEEILKIVEQTNMLEEVIFFSFYKDVLIKIREKNKDIPILFLKTRASKRTIKQAVEIGANAIGVGPLTPINSNFIEKAHSENVEVWRWTVDDKKTIQKMLKLKIDGIITNFPDIAIELRG